MRTRIEVGIRPELDDARGRRLLNRIESDLGITLSSVRVLDVYHIDKDLEAGELERARCDLFSDPVTQVSAVGPLQEKDFDWMVEIGFLPGVTDNVGNTSREALEDLLGVGFGGHEAVYSAEQILLSGDLSRDQVQRIAQILHNPLIQQAWIQDRSAWTQDPMDKGVHAPRVSLSASRQVLNVSLNIPDEELLRLGKEGIPEPGETGDEARRGPLALDEPFLKSIQAHFRKLGRDPTDIELESLAQTWSEHCKHNIFAARIDDVDSLYKTYIQGATRRIRDEQGEGDWCLSVFKDNSGVIRFDDDWSVCYKVETHNSPSALDPYGGAITGIVGVNRDPMGTGMGARLVVNTYGFCFGNPYYDGPPYYRLPDRQEPILHPKIIFEGVREGVEHGGNKSGIPTSWGFLLFDPRYMGKPLVFVGTLGLLPAQLHGKPSYEKQARAGDRIVMAGGRVGKDGIHGATFSSEAMHAGSPATAVQIGDPITQKKMGDAQLEIRDLGLYRSVTDNGAGGLSCSVAEMARECGGCHVDLEQIPIKYEGLLPYEIWISESQERMTYAVPPENVDRFCEIMRRRGVEATVIGEFNDTGRCTVSLEGRNILDLEMDFLHDGVPQLQLKSAYKPPDRSEPDVPAFEKPAAVLKQMMARLNLCSREYVVRQFDHEVQAGSVIKPLAGLYQDVHTDAAVARPLLNSLRGVALSHALHPSYGDIDPYWMAACSIDAAIRKVVTVGADPERISLLDNFCWCSSNEPERLGQLERAARACFDMATAFQAPFVSGKDSMFNDFKGYDSDNNPVKISVPPTLLISSLGIVKDVRSCSTPDAKCPGDRIFLLGTTRDELGGSEYYALAGEKLTGRGFTGRSVPRVAPETHRKLYRAFHGALQTGIIRSAVSLDAGGLAAAVARKTLAGDLGAEINLPAVHTEPADLSPDRVLYSESQGRILITVSPERETEVGRLFHEIPCTCIGRVMERPFLRVRTEGADLYLEVPLEELRESYKKTLGW